MEDILCSKHSRKLLRVCNNSSLPLFKKLKWEEILFYSYFGFFVLVFVSNMH